MKPPHISQPAHALSAQDIDALETRLGCLLPLPYREFLLRTNGGTPKPAFFQWVRDRETREWTWVSGFRSVEPQSKMWISLEFVPEWKQTEIPEGALSIAFGPASQDILLFLAGRRQGQVWYKDYEACLEEGIPEEQLHYLAPSFDAFAAMLTEMPDGAPFVENLEQ